LKDILATGPASFALETTESTSAPLTKQQYWLTWHGNGACRSKVTRHVRSKCFE